jgi:hypothetical protein
MASALGEVRGAAAGLDIILVGVPRPGAIHPDGLLDSLELGLGQRGELCKILQRNERNAVSHGGIKRLMSVLIFE